MHLHGQHVQLTKARVALAFVLISGGFSIQSRLLMGISMFIIAPNGTNFIGHAALWHVPRLPRQEKFWKQTSNGFHIRIYDE